MITNPILLNATGPVVYRMMNDYMFRAICQKNLRVLIGLICSLLHLHEEDIISITIQNPIHLGDAINEKDVTLDLEILLNNNQRLNIEMQVINQHDWPERSLYYLCRSFCQLNKGEQYSDVLPTIHIGILDFTLFEDYPEFYSLNRMVNIKNHHIYSDKIALNVLDLTQIDLATEEDKSYKLDYWAKLFKASTWEEIKMLAEHDKNMQEAALTLRELSEDEQIRMRCEARERNERDQKSLLYNMQKKVSAALQEGLQKGLSQQKQIDEAIIAQKEAELQALRKQLEALSQK